MPNKVKGIGQLLYLYLLFLVLDPCVSMLCLNNGTCKYSNNSISCSCPMGYTGFLCDTSKFHTLPIVATLSLLFLGAETINDRIIQLELICISHEHSKFCNQSWPIGGQKYRL